MERPSHDHSHYCEACGWEAKEREEIAAYVARWTHPDSRYLETQGTVVHAIDGPCYSLERVLQSSPYPYFVGMGPSPLTREQAIATGKRACLVCAPDIPAPPPRPARPPARRLTGLGWPMSNGRCARGTLPRSVVPTV